MRRRVGAPPVRLSSALRTIYHVLVLLVALVGSYHYFIVCRLHHEQPLPPTPLPSRPVPDPTASPTVRVAPPSPPPEDAGARKALSVIQKRFDRAIRFTKSRALTELVETYGNHHEPIRFDIRTSQGVMRCRTARKDVVPVALRYFLEMVEMGFWDNRSQFFRSESHVIQATADGIGHRDPNYAKFQPHGIELQDYSPDYPHKKYRLGIAGRPGGPDFYVNMQENERIHGPGGQGHNYQGDEEADPCFAELIDEASQAVARAIQSLPYDKRGGLRILTSPVRILSIQVIRGEV